MYIYEQGQCVVSINISLFYRKSITPCIALWTTESTTPQSEAVHGTVFPKTTSRTVLLNFMDQEVV